MTLRRHSSIYTILLLSLIAAILMPVESRAQGDALLTQYWALPTYYNPGAVGDTDNIRLRGAGRMQWVGIDNAPKSFVLAADMPFRLFGKQRFGTGLVVQQESMGLFRNLSVNAQIGYKRKLFKGELTAALQIGFFNEQFKGSEVYIPDDDDFHDPDDEAIPRRDVSGNAIDLGLGLFYTHKKFWAGLSLLHANGATVSFENDSETGGSIDTGTGGTGTEGGIRKKYQFKASPTAYFMAGSNIPIKNTLFEVMPSVLVKSDFTFTTGEITARCRYNKFLTAGLGYRWNDAVYAVASVEFKGFYLGYSYDYPTSAIARASSGSHEIFAGYSLKLDLSDKNRHRHKSIRIM